MHPVAQRLSVHTGELRRRRPRIAIQNHRNRQSPACDTGIVCTSPGRSKLGRGEVPPLDRNHHQITSPNCWSDATDQNSGWSAKHERVNTSGRWYNTFKGVSCHTHAWLRDGVDFAGKRVGIIGTGATAVQTIQEIAKTVGHLTVFQRTPNWCAPLHNGKISKEEMRDIRARYSEILALCGTTPGCYIHNPD